MPITSIGYGEQSLSADPTVDYDDIAVTVLANGNYAVSYTTHTANMTSNYTATLSVFRPDGTEIDMAATWQDGSHTTFAALPDGRMAIGFTDETSGEFKLAFGIYHTALSAPISVLGGQGDPGTMLITGTADGRILMLALSGDAVIGQYLEADGTTLDNVFTIYQPAGGSGIDSLSKLKVTTLADGSFLLGWNENVGGNPTYATAILSGNTQPVAAFTDTGYAYHLDSIVGLHDGGYASVSEFSAGGMHEIDLHIGGIDVVAVPQTTAVVDQASVAELADGRLVVTWHLLDNTNGSDPDGAVWAQLFNADGTADGDAFIVNQAFTGDEGAPTVTALPNGRFVIAWHTENAAGNTIDGVALHAYDPTQYKAYSVSGETWSGGELNDNIQGGQGGDHLYGKGGNDVIDGFEGADYLAGGAGRDTVLGNDGDDTLRIGDGDDAAGEVYNGGAGSDWIDIGGSDGAYDIDLRDDTIGQVEHIHLGDPSLVGGTATLHVNASQLGGLEVIDGSGANVKATLDISMGGTQHLFIENGGQLVGFNKAGDLVIVDGTAGADSIYGNGYNERLLGAAGNDSIVGGGGNDSLDGGANDDSILAGSGQDTLAGGSGNDTLSGGAGKDSIDGGSGTHDRADYSYATVKVAATLSGGKATVKLSATDTDKLTGIEDLAGGSKGDALKGDTHANALIGNGGHDTLTGGAGNDHFVFNTALTAATTDSIADFSHGHDKIDLAKAVMTALGSGPALSSAAFYAHAGATHGHDGSDRIVYNTSNGKLYYDDDGSGAHAAVQIATLTGHPTLSAADFVIV